MEYNKFEQPNDFRYMLTTSSVVDMVLDISPKDWQDTTVSIKKDFVEYYANKREFSIPLSFTIDARRELKKEYLTNGINGHAIVNIQLLNRNNWQYEFFYSGFVDFSKANLDKDYIEINFLDNSIQSKMKAFEKTEFEIEFNENDLEADMPSIKTVENMSFFITQSGGDNERGRWGRVTPTTINESSVRLQNIEFRNQFARLKNEDNYQFEKWPTTEENYFGRCFKAGLELEINFNAIINGYYLVDGTNHYFISLVFTEVWFDEASGQWTSESTVVIAGNNYGEGFFNAEIEGYNFTHTTNSDDSYLYWSFQPNRRDLEDVGFGFLLIIEESFFKIKYNDYTDAIVKRVCKTPFDLFQELFRKMTGSNTLPVQSNFLKSIDNLLITSGDSLRNISGALIKTSWQNFWKSISSLYDVAFDIINGVPTIELKSDMLREDIVITHLDDVRNLTVSTALDSIFNDIRVGYGVEDYDTELGREEQNNGQNWITPIDKATKTLDIVSEYRADAYGINDIILRNLYNPNKNDTSTDASSDNDVYMIYCDPTKRFPPSGGNRGYIQVLTLEGLVYNGIEQNDFYYNWIISPKRNLINHSRLLATSNYGLLNQDKQITLTKSDKLANLQVTYLGVTFNEKEPIEVANLGLEYFLPFEITIEAAFDNDFYNTYNLNPLGCITFLYKNNIWKMFIKEIQFDILNRSEFEITGFLCPNQDIRELI